MMTPQRLGWPRTKGVFPTLGVVLPSIARTYSGEHKGTGMSTGRRRKKAARQQSVARWRATATVVPPRAGDRRFPGSNGSVAPMATEELARPDAAEGHGTAPGGIEEQVAMPPPEVVDERGATPGHDAPEERGAAPPADALEDQFYWEDHEQDFRDADDQAEGEDDGDQRDDDDAPTRPVARRRVVAVAVAAPLMFAGAFVAGGWIINQVQDQPSTGLAAIPPVATPSASGTVARPRAATDTYVPGAAAGPGLTEPGALVRATPTADGSLEVVERVRFDQPVSEVSLGPPLTKGVARRSLPAGIEIADLQVQADDDVVDVGQRTLTKARTIRLPGEASAVVMRYRLTGATVRSVPSTPGRALTVLPPITSPATLGSLPFVVELSGASVTNVLCPGLRTADQLCGRTWTLGWYSPPQQPGRTAVLAQLNLPDPVSR